MQTICGKCGCNLSEEEKVFDDIYNCPNCGLEEARSIYKTNVKEYWGEGIDVSKEGSVLLIKGNGAIKDFPDASNNSQILYGIKVIKIDEGITSIGRNAFRGLESLESVHMLGTISIKKSSFFGCTNLINVESPKLEEIGDSAFANCKNLYYINLSNVVRIDRCAFKLCKSLKEVQATKLKTIWYGAFFGCSEISSWSTPELSSIGDVALSFCTSLEKLVLPELTVLGENALECCSSLKLLETPKLDIIGNNALLGCVNLGASNVAKESKVVPTISKEYTTDFRLVTKESRDTSKMGKFLKKLFT